MLHISIHDAGFLLIFNPNTPDTDYNTTLSAADFIFWIYYE